MIIFLEFENTFLLFTFSHIRILSNIEINKLVTNFIATIYSYILI